LLLLINYH